MSHLMTMFGMVGGDPTPPTPDLSNMPTVLYEFAGGPVFLRPKGTGELFTTALSTVDTVDSWLSEELKGGDYGGSYECKLTKFSGTDPTAGPALATWHTINTQLEWEWGPTDAFGGQIDIREIADTGNSDALAFDVQDNP